MTLVVVASSEVEVAAVANVSVTGWGLTVTTKVLVTRAAPEVGVLSPSQVVSPLFSTKEKLPSWLGSGTGEPSTLTVLVSVTKSVELSVVVIALYVSTAIPPSDSRAGEEAIDDGLAVLVTVSVIVTNCTELHSDPELAKSISSHPDLMVP